MITLQEVEEQLKRIGANHRFWGRPEIRELPKILIPGEQIQAWVNCRYSGGFATFCATDQRLLLVDKKPLYLTVEDLRFDMINEVDYCAQLFSATMSVCTPTKTMVITTLNPARLRQVSTYIQQRVMQVRQEFGLHGTMPSLQAEVPKDQQLVQQVVQQPNQAPNEPFAEQPQVIDKAFELPAPSRHNPYMGAPLMIRQRIGRFGVIGTQSQLTK